MYQNGASHLPLPPGVRLFILNDHPIFVEVLGRYLASQPDLRIVGIGLRGPQAYAEIAELQPDVVLVDPGPKLTDIAPTVAHLRDAAPSAGLLVLTLNFDEEYPEICRQAGVEAFVDKLAVTDELLSAIRSLKLEFAHGFVPQSPLSNPAAMD